MHEHSQQDVLLAHGAFPAHSPLHGLLAQSALNAHIYYSQLYGLNTEHSALPAHSSLHARSKLHALLSHSAMLGTEHNMHYLDTLHCMHTAHWIHPQN